MTLVIQLSPDMEQRLQQEAARNGQPAGDFARAVLEERLAGARTPASDPYAGLERATAEEAQTLIRTQGVQPVDRFENLIGSPWPDALSTDDSDVVRRDGLEGGGPSFPYDEPAFLDAGV